MGTGIAIAGTLATTWSVNDRHGENSSFALAGPTCSSLSSTTAFSCSPSFISPSRSSSSNSSSEGRNFRRIGKSQPQLLVINARLGALVGRDACGLDVYHSERVLSCCVRGFNFDRDACRKRRGNFRLHVGNAGPGSSGNPGDTVRTTLEQSRRLLARQKELLQQIEERERLYLALEQNAANPSGQTEAFDEAQKVIQKPSEQIRAQIENPELDGADAKDAKATTAPQVELSPGDNPSKPVPKRPLAAAWPSPISPPGTADARRAKASPFVRSSVQAASPPSGLLSVAPSSAPLVTAPAPITRAKPDPIIPPTTARPETDLDVSEQGAESEPPLAADSATVETGPPLAGDNVMNVVLVAAECAPWSKTGGLGDVVGALPKALARRGHRVMVVAPRYSNYMEAWDTTIRKVYNVAGRDVEVGYFHGYRDRVDFVFVDSPIFHAFAGNIYGGSREEVLLRMVLLCKAAVEAPWHVPCGGVAYGDGNLVFIANDWHTALLPVYLRAYYQDKGLMSFARCILVIHNMAHQGRGPMADFGKFGLPPHYLEKFRLYDPIGGEHCNVFKAGLMSAHRIVTVSHGYAHEVQTRDGGWGLDGVVRENNWKLRGVVNGIDDQEWNPKIDTCLLNDGYVNYSEENLSGKAVCKAALQKELGLPVRSNVPLIGFIGRLDSQKGVDIIAQAIPWMMSQDLQLVMLGTGRKDLEDMLRTFERQYNDKVRGWVGFSVKTAHRITAGVDILLMPSRFEPCGLNQLYAMRYGTIPVVHSVGGLRDTVKPFDPYGDAGTGWTFDRAEASGLIHALGNAMWTYLDYKPSWEALQRRGMTQDLSWDHAAQLYEEVLLAAKYQW